MNLIKNPWLPVIRKNGTREKIAIHQLLKDYLSNPVMDIEAPRPDFRNALYQLLIGLVQVAAMSKNEETWGDLFENPYDKDDFSKKVLEYEKCFEIDSEGPAFMQDYELSDGEEKAISALLIEAPGGKTIKDNQDHFIKRGIIRHVDAYWASIALYTMQTFAPSGGVGHRVGLRGGGPLTTIVLPIGDSTMWEKIWLNVVSKNTLSILAGNTALSANSDFFPWMKPTKTSNKSGSEIYPEEVHPFCHYFGMPRRIRLIFSDKSMECDLTGEVSENIVESFITKNYGNNYDGAWTHPLNAYSHDQKKSDELPLSIKAQPGGVTYRHWVGLAVESDRYIPAKVVRLISESNYRKDIVKRRGAQIWAAGYDMDNMKARCWYESTMPVYPLNPEEIRIVSDFIAKLINVTQELAGSIRYAVKSAWFSSPKDAKGDMSFLDTAFWQNTESQFYILLERVINNLGNDEQKNSLIDGWGKILKKEAESLFDSNALAQQEDGLDMKRIVKARQGLEKGIWKMLKSLKELKGGPEE